MSHIAVPKELFEEIFNKFSAVPFGIATQLGFAELLDKVQKESKVVEIKEEEDA
jgi:hypothetical protein